VNEPVQFENQTNESTIGHSQTRLRSVRERHRACSSPANAHPIRHSGFANKAVDVDFRRSIRIRLESDGADLRTRRGAVNSIDIDLAVPRTSNGVSSWEVDFKAAAVGTSRDGEGDSVVALVCTTGILGNDVVDRESNCFWVCGAAGARENAGVASWGSGGDERRTHEGGGKCEEPHLRSCRVMGTTLSLGNWLCMRLQC
jgi:hypothetical protein